MMLCLALRSSPRQVHQRARHHFTDDEISEGFAAAHGLALPSQLRHLIRTQGLILHTEFQTLLPARRHRISIQRWSPRRIGLLLLTAIVLAVLTKISSFVLVNNDVTTTTLEVASVDCDPPELLWLQAQSVPSASVVPCLRPLPPVWTLLRGPMSETAGRSSPSTTTGSAPARWSSGSPRPATPAARSSGPPTSPARDAMNGLSRVDPNWKPPGTPCSPAAASTTQFHPASTQTPVSPTR